MGVSMMLRDLALGDIGAWPFERHGGASEDSDVIRDDKPSGMRDLMQERDERLAEVGAWV